jgi:hypothetical protein
VVSFPQVSPQNPVYASPPPHTRYTPRRSHLDFIARKVLAKEYRSFVSIKLKNYLYEISSSYKVFTCLDYK